MMRPWLHSDFIYKKTKMFKIQEKARLTSSLRFTDEIIKKGRIYKENFVDNADGLRNSVECLFDPRNNLTEDEIRDEINTIIIAVSLLKT